MHRPFILGTVVVMTASVFATQKLSFADGSPIDPNDFDAVFESYPPCQKLEVIDSDGKDVVQYLIDSGYDEFETAINTSCTDFVDELQAAMEFANAQGESGLCVGLVGAASTVESKEQFVDLAYEIYYSCPGRLAALADEWQVVKASDPDLAFDILHPCDKLERKAGLGELDAGYIVNSGVDDFTFDVLAYCPDHLGVMAAALDVSQDQGSGADEPVAIGPLNPEFESRAKCDKLAIIESDGKDLVAYIRDSGVEDFAFDIPMNCPGYADELERAR